MNNSIKNNEMNLLEGDDSGRNGWDRRDFLKCIGAWAGTGLVLAMTG